MIKNGPLKKAKKVRSLKAKKGVSKKLGRSATTTLSSDLYDLPYDKYDDVLAAMTDADLDALVAAHIPADVLAESAVQLDDYFVHLEHAMRTVGDRLPVDKLAKRKGPEVGSRNIRIIKVPTKQAAQNAKNQTSKK